MSIETKTLVVSGLRVEVVRKEIKNLHLGVYPPNGRVRVAAPLMISDEAVRLAVIEKLSWIRRQQTAFENQRRQSERDMVNGESHYFLGQRYRLRVVPATGVGHIVMRRACLDLHVRPDCDAPYRRQVLQEWYRAELKKLVPELLAKWEPVLGVQACDWRIRRMKTKWGSCSPAAGRIWLNSELAKTPLRCIEYIVVHELAHLIERQHGERFRALMDKVMPQWQQCRTELGNVPLSHEEW